MVEADLIQDQNTDKPVLGSLVNVVIEISLSLSKQPGLFFLPLPAINITPSDNFVFVLDGEQVKKSPVEIVKIDGEMATVKASWSLETRLIVDGNKLITDGEKVKVE